MSELQDVYFLTGESKSDVTQVLVKKLSKKIEADQLMDNVKNISTIQECSGKILLVSYSFVNSINCINKFAPNFEYVNFIDPIAYSQMDEERLYEQIKKIESANLIQKQQEKWTSDWNYYDYYRMNYSVA